MIAPAPAFGAARRLVHRFPQSEQTRRGSGDPMVAMVATAYRRIDGTSVLWTGGRIERRAS